MRILLASASPRRAELLRTAGFAFDVLAADVDERVHPDERPEDYVSRVSEMKASAVGHVAAGRTVLAADTVVVIDGQILGKPRDERDAARMLQLLSGRTHEVVTGVTVVRGHAEPPAWDPLGPATPDHPRPVATRVAFTRVELAVLSEEEIAWYVHSGEPADKAGAYAIQGLASRFVTRIDGSYSNVVGLPVALVYQMLQSR